jgi:hypothetical protein
VRQNGQWRKRLDAFTKYPVIDMGEDRNMKNQLSIAPVLAAILALACLMVSFPAGSQAKSDELPDRNTATAAAHGGDGREDSPDKPAAASIELYAPGVAAGVWTVVQWQGSDGNWHDIDGWRGQTDAAGRVKWSVALKDFGAGAFRWQVLAGGEGQPPSISEPFTLPGKADETLLVTMAQK